MKVGRLARVAMLDFVIHLAKKAGGYLKENIGTDLQVEFKGRINPVTRVDKGAQEIIFGEIEHAFPNHSVIAEEGLTKEAEAEFTWFVDPLDGTVNYVHRIPIFCVSIAVYKDMKPYIGVCYNPVSEELFYSEQGKGAFRNEKRIFVSETSSLIDALVVTGFPYSGGHMEEVISRFSRIIGEVQGIRRLGSAALDLCYVAAGSFDGYWEIGLSPWDVAAGAAIVLEAGGVISGIDGKPFDVYSRNILAGNPMIHKDLGKIV